MKGCKEGGRVSERALVSQSRFATCSSGWIANMGKHAHRLIIVVKIEEL